MGTRIDETRLWIATFLKSIGDGVITIEKGGTILSMNGAAEVLTGWTQNEAVGKEFGLVLRLREAQTLSPARNHVDFVLGQGCSVNVSTGLLLIARDGTAIPVEYTVAAGRDGGGAIAGASLTFRGLAEPRPTAEAFEEAFHKVQQAKREWESTVDSLSDLILLIDAYGQVIRANRTVESWNLGQVTEVSERKAHDIIHHDCADSHCTLDAFIQAALGQTGREKPLEREYYDQVLSRYLLVKAKPVLDSAREVVQATVIVMQDISERKQSEESLRQYAAELKARNEELDAFSHTVAHDLKNPIGLVIGLAEFLLEGRSAPSHNDMVDSMQTFARVGHKMNSIIEELLLLAGLRDAQFEAEALDMWAVVAEARRRLEYVIKDRGGEIVLERPEVWPQALGYAPWVEEVWTNYISNALKYGGQPPRVKVGAISQPDGMARFWVHDNGNGLSPQEQAVLFAPFKRLKQVRTEGHGLGLSIVRRIIEKLGGQVGVESDGVPGHGSTFYFTLPSVPRGASFLALNVCEELTAGEV